MDVEEGIPVSSLLIMMMLMMIIIIIIIIITIIIILLLINDDKDIDNDNNNNNDNYNNLCTILNMNDSEKTGMGHETVSRRLLKNCRKKYSIDTLIVCQVKIYNQN